MNRRFCFSRRRGFLVACYPSLCIKTVRSCFCTMEVQFFFFEMKKRCLGSYKLLDLRGSESMPFCIILLWELDAVCLLLVVQGFRSLFQVFTCYLWRCQASRGSMILSTVTLQLKEIHSFNHSFWWGCVDNDSQLLGEYV